MSKVRVPVAGTVGKSIRVDRESTAGATIGTDLRLPNGSVPSLSQLAAALGVNQGARQSSLSNTIWKLIREVPEVLASVGDLTDPNEDAIFYWDDVNGIADWMTEIPDSFLSANVALYDGSVAQFSAGTFLNARISETNVTQHEAAIDHNALTNFVEAQHIDWSVTGIENIHVDRISEAIDQPYVAALGFYTETEIDAFGFLTSVLAANVDSGAATDGYVLTADGAGGAAWEAAPAGGVTDHGALTGLADNDHPQYARLASNETITGDWTFDRSASDNNFVRGGGSDAENFALLVGNSYDGALAPIIRGFGATAAASASTLNYSVPEGGEHIFSSVSTGADIRFNSTINNLIAGSTNADFDALTATSYGGIAEANLLDKTATETVSGVYTFTQNAGLRLSAALPELRISATGAAADNKDWLQHLTSAGDLRYAIYAEGFGGGGVAWMNVFRTGTTVDEIELNATTLDFNGSPEFNSRLRIAGSGFVTDPADFVVGQYNSTTGYVQTPGGTTGRFDVWNSDSSAIAFFSNAEIELNATLLDFNGDAEISGTLTVGGNAVWDTGDFNIANYYSASQINSYGIGTNSGAFPVDLTADIQGGLYAITTTTLNQPTNLSADRGGLVNMRRGGNPNTFQIAVDNLGQTFTRGGDYATTMSAWKRSWTDADFDIDNYALLAGATFTGAILAPAGSAGAPSYAFSGDTDSGMALQGSNVLGLATTGVYRALIYANHLRIEGDTTLSIREQAAANADLAAYGQIWVKNNTPNELFFTDDTGVDHTFLHHVTSGYLNGAKITVGSTAPGSPVQGDMWFDTS